MLKKIFLVLLLFTAVSAVLVYFFGSSALNAGIKKGVEKIGPKITDTSVILNEVDLSVLSGKGRIAGLYVGNPEGYSSEHIFALGQVELDIEPLSILSDKIVINRIYIQAPQISYEKKLRSSNLKDLLENIEGSSETTETEEPEQEETSEIKASAKEVLIKEFVIEDANLFIGLMGVGTTVKLSRIELYDIDGQGDKVVSSIIKQVVANLLEQIKAAQQDAKIDPRGLLDSLIK